MVWIPGPIQRPQQNPFRDTDKFFGTSKGFGFTKLNEVFVGRVAQLGFLAAVIGEKVTGDGSSGVDFRGPIRLTCDDYMS
jgi:hypothetical protein